MAISESSLLLSLKSNLNVKINVCEDPFCMEHIFQMFHFTTVFTGKKKIPLPTAVKLQESQLLASQPFPQLTLHTSTFRNPKTTTVHMQKYFIAFL